MLSRTAMRTGGITAHRLGKNVTFYVNETTAPAAPGRPPHGAPDPHRPLMLMLPWLGSRPQALTKYCEIYFRTGFDVLIVESEVQEFLWPRWCLDHGQNLLELLHTERFVSRPLLVHAFSIGAFTFSQLLVLMSRDMEKYEELTKRIKGQVYDSLVIGSVERMATGLGKTLYPRFHLLIKRMSLLYFSIFQHQTVDYFNKAIDVFWNTPITAPALFFFCENDVMSDSQVMEELIEHWRKRGINVTAKKWCDSLHAGHIKRHPQEYTSALNMFLHSIQAGPLKAKM